MAGQAAAYMSRECFLRAVREEVLSELEGGSESISHTYAESRAELVALFAWSRALDLLTTSESGAEAQA